MTPPDKTQGLERLRLLFAQRLDFDRATIGWLLDEVERLKAAVAEEREACADAASVDDLRDWPLNNCCNKTQGNIIAAIRARGEAK